MGPRAADGSAGDADYGRIGAGYRDHRLPEPEFARAILTALGPARTVVNVGAGAGSYEPADREVTPVEPSASMRAQRPAHLAPAVDATAEALPFPDDAFDAAMTSFSAHQWRDLEAGLAELRRVARGPVVVLTCDPELMERYWLAEYAPEVLAGGARRYPSVDRLAAGLGGTVDVTPLPIPLACTDGFGEAYYGRPEKFLDPAVRKAMSSWSFITEPAADRAVARLRADLADGTWDDRHGHLRTTPHYKGSLILLTATP
ncbi:class I SAM-dependent methyltransferase [Glycomyces paridis]|uniref:Class I SAM-dependent methyltransferase n=1 Tax=Glycomyces paridis TaxID=2126555 RepID=A0A4S8PDJ6_9ACTN|nr:methyltransferase domain-containing protein [Glycomyces paridis]THV28448.1 class I SAM-dependent methyltransferase [Glycomyces paridis]